MRRVVVPSLMAKSIFLSHSHKDRAFTSRLAADLTKHGVRVWLDAAEIKIGDSLVDRLASAIAEMDYLGVILTRDSVRSAWVRKEVSVALTQEVHSRRVRVLPILAEKCELPAFLVDKVYADCTTTAKYDTALRRLLDRLGSADPGQRATVGDPAGNPVFPIVTIPLNGFDAENNDYVRIGKWDLRADVSYLDKVYIIGDDICYQLKIPKELGIVYDFSVFSDYRTERADDSWLSSEPWLEVYIKRTGRSRLELQAEGERILVDHSDEIERCWQLVGRLD